MSKLATFFLISLLFFSLTNAARPEPAHPYNSPVKTQHADPEAGEESCDGVAEEECLMRRALTTKIPPTIVISPPSMSAATRPTDISPHPTPIPVEPSQISNPTSPAFLSSRPQAPSSPRLACQAPPTTTVPTTTTCGTSPQSMSAATLMSPHPTPTTISSGHPVEPPPVSTPTTVPLQSSGPSMNSPHSPSSVTASAGHGLLPMMQLIMKVAKPCLQCLELYSRPSLLSLLHCLEELYCLFTDQPH